MKKLNRIVLFAIIIFTIIASVVSCQKQSDALYEVTYTFTNVNPSYTIQIWDGTGKNDVTQSVSGTSFSKTIKYDYTGTYRCNITNTNSIKSKMSISITYDGTTTTCSDSLFASIECFRNI